VRIRWEEIPPDGLLFEIPDDSWLPDDGLVCQGQPRCSVSLKKEDNRVLLSASLRMTVLFACDRCLEPFPGELVEDFSVSFELTVPRRGEDDPAECSCGADEPDVVLQDEPVIDLFAVLNQQVYLALPAKRLCRDNCAGLCHECGSNLNQGPCACRDQGALSPFAVLARLKAH